LLLNKTKKLILLIYSGMVSGLILSLGLSHFVWIDMRINTSILMPLSIFAWTGAGIFLKKTPPAVLVLILQAGLGIALLYTCGADMSAWAVMPAILTREGLLLKFMDLSFINLILFFSSWQGIWHFFPFPGPLKKPIPLTN